MRHILFAAIVAASVAGAGNVQAQNAPLYGKYPGLDCRVYLGVYSRTELIGREGWDIRGGVSFGIFDWIDGYISGLNMAARNGNPDLLGSMTMNDVRRWVASWCRDQKPTTDIMLAMPAFIRSRDPSYFPYFK